MRLKQFNTASCPALLRHFGLVTCLAATIGWGSGCGTSFKFTPTYSQGIAAVPAETGLAIATGADERPTEERRPDWAKDGESIVAHALADEVRHAKLFKRVKIHADSVNVKKYPTVVRFRVRKFECHDQTGFFEETGKTILRFQGLRGALIAESLPTKYIAEVEVEFEVVEAGTQRTIFSRSYSATKMDAFNGYQREGPKVRLTSAALEEVMTRFVGDLETVSMSR